MNRIIAYYVDLIEENKEQQFRYVVWMILSILPFFLFMVPIEAKIDIEPKGLLVARIYFLLVVPFWVILYALIHSDNEFIYSFHSSLWIFTIIAMVLYAFFGSVIMAEFYKTNKLVFCIMASVLVLILLANLISNIIHAKLPKGLCIFICQIVIPLAVPYIFYVGILKAICHVHDDIEAERLAETKRLQEMAAKEQRSKEAHDFWSDLIGGRPDDFEELSSQSKYDLRFDQKYSVNGHTYYTNDAGYTWTDENGKRFDSDGDPL